MNIRAAQAFASIQLLAVEDLPAVATEALVEGFDAPALRLLAGGVDRTAAEAWELFFAAVDQLQLPPVDVDAATLFVARYLANEVMDGQVDGALGLRRIRDVLSRIVHGASWEDLPDELRAEIGTLIGLADDSEEYQDIPWLRQRIERDQLAHIAALAGRPQEGVPVWSAGLVYDKRRGWSPAEPRRPG